MDSPEYTLEDIKDRKVDYDMSIVYGMPFIEVNLYIKLILNFNWFGNREQYFNML